MNVMLLLVTVFTGPEPSHQLGMYMYLNPLDQSR